jgi:hypothetical protein
VAFGSTFSEHWMRGCGKVVRLVRSVDCTLGDARVAEKLILFPVRTRAFEGASVLQGTGACPSMEGEGPVQLR